MTQGINEQVGAISAIEAEFHLFKIGREMLCAKPVPRSHDAALEKRESGFDSIGVNISHNIDALAVSNLLVILHARLPNRRVIRGSIISKNHFHVLAYIVTDVLRECATLCISGMEEAEIAVALTNANDHFFVVHASD